MSTWTNTKKKASSFAMKGLVYGAVAGAVLGVGMLLVGGAGLYLAGMLTTMQIGSVAGAAEAAVAGVQGGAALLTGEGMAICAAGGALVGSLLGAAGGVAAGSLYGAAMDKDSPLPHTMEKLARKISDKTPGLAQAIARNVNTENAIAQQPKHREALQTMAQAPELSAAPAPRRASPQSFQDRLASAQPPEANPSVMTR